MRTAGLNSGLPEKPGDRLLWRIPGMVDLGAALQVVVFESQLKGLALGSHHLSGIWSKTAKSASDPWLHTPGDGCNVDQVAELTIERRDAARRVTVSKRYSLS